MNGQQFIYFDNINTTFAVSEAIAAANQALNMRLGNPSSHIHSAGIEAGKILDEARGDIAALIQSKPENIIFTSGATEANNLAVTGFLKANPGYQLVVSEIEHFSIVNQARRLARDGAKAHLINVDKLGVVDLSQLEGALKSSPSLVSISPANSEIGTIQNMAEIGKLCKSYGAILHADATAAAAFLEINVQEYNIDLLTLSGHNMYAPTGIGALYISDKVRLAPLFEGGNQQLGFRPGTENVSGAAGLGAACRLINENRTEWSARLRELGRRLWDGLSSKVPFLHPTGHPTRRLPGHVSFWVEHIEGESLLLLLNMKGIMAASGSACSSNLKGRNEDDLLASHVLTAVGVPRDICAGSITFSLSRYNTQSEVDYVIAVVPEVVDRLLAMSPSYSDYIKRKE